MTGSTARPDFIGTMTIGGRIEFCGATGAEIDRGAFVIARVLRSFAFAPASTILTVSMVPEIIQYGVFERAVQMLGFLGINAEDSPFDAGRVESIVRQFDTPGICGVSKATLDGLVSLGHDPAACFAGRTVWARADAYDAVAALGGVDARRVVSIGPALALECAQGNIHYDSRDWSIDAPEGRLRISSRHDRVEPLTELDTGIAGEVSDDACRCGTKEGFVRLS